MESKFWRKEPIKKFNTEQTIYSLVTDEAKNDLDLEATGFMGNSMTYRELFESAEDLAKSFNAMGVKEGDNVAILTISMPLVQQCLLSLSKIGATMSWIDLRVKEKDLINYINNGNCKVVVVFEDLLPLVENISGDINAERVIVCSPKEYLSPVIKVLAGLKDKTGLITMLSKMIRETYDALLEDGSDEGNVEWEVMDLSPKKSQK